MKRALLLILLSLAAACPVLTGGCGGGSAPSGSGGAPLSDAVTALRQAAAWGGAWSAKDTTLVTHTGTQNLTTAPDAAGGVTFTETLHEALHEAGRPETYAAQGACTASADCHGTLADSTGASVYSGPVSITLLPSGHTTLDWPVGYSQSAGIFNSVITLRPGFATSEVRQDLTRQ